MSEDSVYILNKFRFDCYKNGWDIGVMVKHIAGRQKDRKPDGFSALYSERLATTNTIWHEDFKVLKFYGLPLNCLD